LAVKKERDVRLKVKKKQVALAVTRKGGW